MATLLYVFPHPDDESFGPAPAIARQRREGHAVHLLTLTRGEATKQRHRYGYSKEEMGEVRTREMEGVARALDLSSLTVLDFPDGGLADLDPRQIEAAVEKRIQEVRPEVVVTYAVHGISGHPDHLVGHHVVKRVFCAMRDGSEASPRRLAFFTLPEEQEERPEHLTGSPEERISCIVSFSSADRERAQAALDCYETYQAVIQEHQPLQPVAEGVCFELFQEEHDERLDDLTAGL